MYTRVDVFDWICKGGEEKIVHPAPDSLYPGR